MKITVPLRQSLFSYRERIAVPTHRLNHYSDPEHEKNCQEACCLRFKTEEPDYTPTVGNAQEPKDRLYGYIDISFNLSSDASMLMDISIRYSLDGGRTFRKCTPAEDTIPLRQLPTCPHGIRYSFTWDSEADLKHGRHENVRIMLLVHKHDGILFHPFVVDNRCLSPFARDEDDEEAA
jgi:hypothetical protein